ncbi:MAG TPA: WGxxGxxG family protein [Planctomycetaceae bacterium]|nr:WGxxGxxG family protein [Planctomycetaceae bacterium]
MRLPTSTRNASLCVLALTLSPAAAMAATAATVDTTYESRDDDGFDWGLLGLLGLAGLLGLKKKDDDIHVDARRNPPR